MDGRTEEESHLVEIEASVLGGLMDGSLQSFEQAGKLQPNDFLDDMHVLVFGTIRDVMHKGGRPNYYTVTDAILPKLPEEDRADARAYMEALENAAAYDAALPQYTDMVLEASNKRQLRDALRAGIQMTNSGDVPFSEALDAAQKAVMRATEAGDPFKPSDISAAMRASMTPIDELGGIRVHSGLHELDNKLGAFESGTSTVLAGRPSMGKTVGASEIALNVAIDQRRCHGDEAKDVAFFSLEMPARQLGARFNSSMAHRVRGGQAPTYRKILEGNLTESEFAALEMGRDKAAGLPLQIYDKPKLTVPMMRAALRRLQMGKGVALCVIDYLQLIRPAGREQSREREVAQISADIKEMALDLKIPVILLSQLNRGVESREDKRPRLDDLRESGSIEQDADNVVMTYREAYYAQRATPPKDDEGLAEHVRARESDALEFIIAKNRNGPLGAAHQRCDVSFSRVMEKQETEESLI
jgi:replicative DNA helicase